MGVIMIRSIMGANNEIPVTMTELLIDIAENGKDFKDKIGKLVVLNENNILKDYNNERENTKTP